MIMVVMLYAIHLSYFADIAHCQSVLGPYFLITLGLIQLTLCHTSKDKGDEIRVWCTTFLFVMVVLNEVKQDLGLGSFAPVFNSFCYILWRPGRSCSI